MPANAPNPKESPLGVGAPKGARTEGLRLSSPEPLPGSFADVNREALEGPEGRPDAAAPAAAPAPSGLPCLNSNNSTGTLSGGHRRTAFALQENVKALSDRFGIERLGFLTLTFRDHVTTTKEAQRRFNSLRTHVLATRYAASIAVIERQKSGRIHFHLLVVLAEDVRTGFDFNAIASQDYKTANAYLRSEWSFWRQTAPKYRFGRTELLPIKSTVDAISKYVGKYIAKHIEARDPRDKGARLVRYTADARQVGTRFAWVGLKPALWRAKVAAVAEEFGCRDTDGFKSQFGPRWAYHLSEYIMNHRLTKWPSYNVQVEDLRLMAERGYFDPDTFQPGHPSIAVDRLTRDMLATLST